MSKDLHQRCLEVFQACFELPSEQRAAVLEQMCGRDLDLRQAVEDLLARHDQSGCGLDQPALGAGFQLAAHMTEVAPARALEGRRIGGCHLKRLIAAGGMGAVYEAVQESPRRTVAVKVLKRGLASRSALRRFEYEAQILARLRHPGIAQIHEAGTFTDESSGEAVPYFVMEYIPNARSLTEFARNGALGTRERLALFARACQAVHHGHQKGIIHRDLKPANILVDSSGDVKIIDFGVARSTDSDLAVTTLQTDVGQLIGTLQYMSPEQCAGDPHDLDTRSDIYALGVVLFELLCGQLPYDVRQAALHDAVNVVREATPVRPSTVDRTLRGDLETITLKALEKQRERRYQSALDLAQDLQRYLNHEAIMARPPSVAYQLRKFARRHRAAATALAGIALALTGGIVATSWQAIRATRAEEAASTEASTANAVIDLLNQMLSSADPHEVRGSTYTVRSLLDEFAAGLNEQLKDQPDVEAAIRATIGTAYLHLGLPDAAEPHLLRAMELRQRDRDDLDPNVLSARLSLISVLHDRGQFSEAEGELRRILDSIGDREDLAATRQSYNATLAEILFHLAHYDDAERLHLEILAARRRALGDEHPDTLASMQNLGNVYPSQGRYAEAEALWARVLEIRKRVLGEEHPDTLASMYNLGKVYFDQGRYAEAEALYRQALESRRRVLGEDHPKTLASMNNLANVYRTQGRYAEAEALHARVVEIRKRVLGEGHRETLGSMCNLAVVYRAQGRYTDAEALLIKTLEIMKRVLGDEDEYTVMSMQNLALVYANQGRYAEAEALYAHVLEIRKRVLGEEHPDTLMSMFNLANEYYRQGRYAEAEALYRQALDIRRRVLGEEHPDTLKAMNNLAVVYQAQGRYAEAEAMNARVLEIRKRVLGEEHPNTLVSMNILANVYKKQGRYADAEALYVRVLEIRKRVLGEEHRDTLASMYNLANVYHDQGRYAEAEAMHARVLEIRKRVLGEEDRDTLVSMYDLAYVYDIQGRYADSGAMHTSALEIARRVFGDENPLTLVLMGAVAGVYSNQGRYADAEAMYASTLETQRRILGEEHPYTAVTMINFAWHLVRFPDWEGFDPERAVELALAAAEVSPAAAPTRNTLGMTLYWVGRFEESIAALEKSVELRPPQGHTTDWYFMAMAWERLGNHERALECFQTAGSGSKEGFTPADLERFERIAREVLGIDERKDD